LQIDQAQAQYISLLIADCGARDNAPVIVCPAHHSQACIPLNVSACADELETKASQLGLFAGSSAGTKLL